MNNFYSHKILSLLCLFGAVAISGYGQADTLKHDPNDSLLQKKKDFFQPPTIPNKNELKKDFFGDSLKKPTLPKFSKADFLKNIVNGKIKPNSFLKSSLSLFKNNSTHGQISFGYDYGILPFITNASAPSGYFRTEGNMSFKLLSFPFNASFYYSQQKNITGLNNFFRIVYDENKFRQDLNNKALAQQDQIKNEITSLYSQKQIAEQKMYYYKYQQQYNGFNYNTPQLPNTNFSQNNPNVQQIENKTENQIADSLKNKESDSLDYIRDKKQKADSINTQVKKYEGQVVEYESKIWELNKKLEDLKDTKKLMQNPSNFLGKGERLFGNVKKLEIGMCYPNYSTFLVSGIAIKGINRVPEKRFFSRLYRRKNGK